MLPRAAGTLLRRLLIPIVTASLLLGCSKPAASTSATPASPPAASKSPPAPAWQTSNDLTTRAAQLLGKLDQLAGERRAQLVRYDADGEPTSVNLPSDLSNDESIRLLSRCPHLQQLSIICARAPISAGAVAALRRLPALRELNVSGFYPTITREAALALESFPALRVLSVSYAKVDPDALPVLARMPRLQTLKIGSNGRFTDRDAAVLAKSRSIEDLDLSGTAVTDACLPALASMPRLARLRADRTNATENGLAVIGFSQERRVLPAANAGTPPPPSNQ